MFTTGDLAGSSREPKDQFQVSDEGQVFLKEGVERGTLGRLTPWGFFYCLASPRGLARYPRHTDFLRVFTQWLKASGREKQTNTVNNEKYEMKVKQRLS